MLWLTPLEIINDTIRFQGKAGGLFRRGPAQVPPRPSIAQRVGDSFSESLVSWERGNIVSSQSVHSLPEDRPPSLKHGAGFQPWDKPLVHSWS